MDPRKSFSDLIRDQNEAFENLLGDEVQKAEATSHKMRRMVEAEQRLGPEPTVEDHGHRAGIIVIRIYTPEKCCQRRFAYKRKNPTKLLQDIHLYLESLGLMEATEDDLTTFDRSHIIKNGTDLADLIKENGSKLSLYFSSIRRQKK
jgi:hypothetical protein